MPLYFGQRYVDYENHIPGEKRRSTADLGGDGHRTRFEARTRA